MPPEYVLELMPVEVLGAVALLAAILWVVKMISKARAQAHGEERLGRILTGREDQER